MSLLNDALKAAEQRQDRSITAAAYTGQASATPRRGGTGKVAMVALLILGAGVGGYVFLPLSAPDASKATATPVASEPYIPTVPEAEPVSPVAAVELAADPAPAPVENLDGQPLREPRAPMVTDEPELSQATLDLPQPEPEPVSGQETVVEVPLPTPADYQPQETEVAAVAQPEQEASAAPVNIKQPRQTPEQKDRDTRDELGKLIARGELGVAESALSALTETQPAPLSRYVLARALLVNGKPDEALRWIPEGLVLSSPDLRLIRARALLAKHDLEAALRTLNVSVPPVRNHVEYRVTLATLMQQQGQNGAAAGHWAELIAWDDSQAPWWVGLAIALEGRGDLPAARRAYEQAAALPGLAPSLADYVRQRLQTLRAG